MSRVWLITGVSSGFGRAVAELALARGDTVIGTLRKAEQCVAFEQLASGRAIALRLDVTHAEDVSQAADRAVQERGRIDVLFNNAGFGMVGTVEETTLAEARAIFETNFFGMLQLTRALLPQLRRQRSGHILNMSSGAGIGAVPGLSLYSATKFAVEGLSEALAGEVAQFGIKVTVIEPGAFNTGFPTSGIVETRERLSVYAAITGHGAAGIQHYYGAHAGHPMRAARAILKIVDEPQPPLRLVLGPDALRGVRAKIDALKSNVDAWEALTLSTVSPAATTR